MNIHLKRPRGQGTANIRQQAALQSHSEALILFSQQLYSILDVHQVCQFLCSEGCRLTNSFATALLREGEGGWQVVATSGSEPLWRIDASEHLPVFRLFAEEALRSSSPIAFPLVPESHAPQYRPIIEKLNHVLSLTEALATGVRTRQGRAALLLFASNPEPEWAESNRSLLAGIATIGAVAVSNAQLHRNAREKANELQQLLDLCAQLASTSNLERFLETFVTAAVPFLNFQRGYIALLEEGRLEVRYAAESATGRHMRVNIDSTRARKILDSRNSFWHEDVTADSEADQELARMFSIKQYLGVPIFSNDGQVFGVLGLLDKEDGRPIGAEDVKRAETLAAQVALALQSIQTLELASLNQRRAEHLVGLALDMGTSLSLPELVRSFLGRASNLLGAGFSLIGLCREASRGALIESIIVDDAHREGDHHPAGLSQALSTFAATHNDVLFTGPAATALGTELAARHGWKYVLICRLTGATSELLGLLLLADCAEKLTPDSLQLLQALAGHASMALENSRLFTRIARSNKQWAEIFDSIEDFIVVHDDEDRVMRVNRPFAAALDHSPSDVIGAFMQELIRDPGPKSARCPLCIASGQTDEFRHSLFRGQYLLSSSKVRSGLNEGVQTVHVLRDVSERREAERRYRELFDNVQEGVFFASPSGRFIDVNDALVRMLGYASREEMLRMDVLSQFYAKQDTASSPASHTSGSREVVLRRKNGSLIYALEHSIPVRDAAGNIVQYRGLVLDITETKNFQTQLQRQRDFNTQILNNTQSLILVADTAGLISYANRRCYEAIGLPQDSLVGRRITELVSEGDHQTWAAGFERTLSGVPVSNLEVQIAGHDGDPKRFSLSLSPMGGEAGAVTSVVIVMTDITEVAAIQAKLMHTEKMAAIGQLVSGVAHEVNNPLTAILGFADLMLENPAVPPAIQNDLNVIVQEAQRTKEIVQNLLSFARQAPKQKQQVDVNAVLRRTIALRTYDFANGGITVREDFAEPAPHVLGDPHQLQQAFLNILNNAHDAIRDAAARGTIEIHTGAAHGAVKISFSDDGPGIKHPEKIFDPFFTTKEVGKGTGLGLSICYGIIRQHGGEIQCHNNTHAPGATFLIKLPEAEPAVVRSRGAARGKS